jgi:phospholipid/cholesterol/gamma-HCH transport system substrate-binding protein
MKNILIGLFVTGAIAIMISLVLFLKPTVGDGKKILCVRFTNIAGITVGTRVSFAGKPVGEVISIKELPNARDHADEMGRIYMYELVLKLYPYSFAFSWRKNRAAILCMGKNLFLSKNSSRTNFL